MRRSREKENKRRMPNENGVQGAGQIRYEDYPIIISRNVFAFVPLAHPSVHPTSFPLFPLLALYFPSPPTVHMYPVEYDPWELNC